MVSVFFIHVYWIIPTGFMMNALGGFLGFFLLFKGNTYFEQSRLFLLVLCVKDYKKPLLV